MHAASSPDLRSLAGTGARLWWQYQQLRYNIDILPLSERRADVNYRSWKTETGIIAAASLQDGKININLTSLSGVVHVAACAQARVAAVTVPAAAVSLQESISSCCVCMPFATQ